MLNEDTTARLRERIGRMKDSIPVSALDTGEEFMAESEAPTNRAAVMPESGTITAQSGARDPTRGRDPAGGPPGGPDGLPANNGPTPEEGEFYPGQDPSLDTSSAEDEIGQGTFGDDPLDEPASPDDFLGEGDAGGGGQYGGAGVTFNQGSNVGGDSTLPDDLSVEEDPNGPWGGNKPDYLQNMPEDMPQAEEWEVTDEQLVEKRMRSLMDEDNAVFQALQEQVQRAHAARGGKNSLMASRSAVMMMANMAFNIASQDAATLARSAEFNAAMKNQFGLAQQQFMHNALLSDQNFRQGVYIVREQNRARMSEISASISGQLAAIDRQFAGNLQLEEVRHDNQLEIMDRGHGQNLERDELNFQHNWMLGEQGQAHALERNDRETDNAIRVGDAQAGRAMQLQYLTEVGATGRQLLATVGDIASNPNIKGEQVASAIRDATHNYNSMLSMLRTFYAAGSPGQGGAGGAGGADGGTGLNNPAIGNYLSYNSPMFGPGRGYSLGQGGYQAYAPPTARFWGGSGTTNQPMYGSNRDYANNRQSSNPSERPPASAAPPPAGDAPALPGPGTPGGGGASPNPGVGGPDNGDRTQPKSEPRG